MFLFHTPQTMLGNLQTVLLFIELVFCLKSVVEAKLFSQEKFDVSDLDGLKLEDAFLRLNLFLISSTASAEADLNFGLVHEKYKAESGRWFSSKSQSTDDMKAMRLFLAMGNIKDENRCEPESYNILIQVDRATSDKSRRRLDPDGIARRIERILLDYVLKQIDQCHEAHLEQFKHISRTMDQDKVKIVDIFFGPSIERLASDQFQPNRDKSRVQRLYNMIAEKISSLSSRSPKRIMESLKALVSDDEYAICVSKYADSVDIRELLVKDAEFRELYKNYLVRPCRYYTQKLGPEVFKVVYFEDKFQHSLDEKSLNFYESWTRFHLCNQFIGQYEYMVWQHKQLALRERYYELQKKIES